MPDHEGPALSFGPIYALVDDSVVPPERMAAVATALVDGGARLIQLRLKRADDRTRLATQRSVAEQLAGRNVTLCVNDRPDLCKLLAMEAPPGVHAALHLGQDDVPPLLARRIVGDRVAIGLSTHTPDQVAAARHQPVDYLGFGPLFTTQTKANPDPVVGLAGLAAACTTSSVPVVGIGGIRADRIADVIGAGAAAAAVVGALYAGLDVVAHPELVSSRFRSLCQRAGDRR